MVGNHALGVYRRYTFAKGRRKCRSRLSLSYRKMKLAGKQQVMRR
ncbi:hypothetical protein ACLK1T_12605 [Escherichia coli]